MASKIPVLNSLYVYKTRHVAPFTHRLQEASGYRFIESKSVRESKENEINIYHLTAEVDGVQNGLTLVTRENNSTKVAKFMNESVLKIMQSSALSNKFKLAKLAPSEVGIYYTK